MNRFFRTTTAMLLVLTLGAFALAACSSSSSKTPVTASNAGTAASSQATTASKPASSPSSTTKKTGGSSIDVCALLPAAQASSINSVTYDSSQSKSVASGYDTCTYHNSGSVDPIDIQNLDVSLLSLSGCWTSLQTADGPGTNVDGIGDAAFGYSIGIDVKVGDRCLEISGLTHAEFKNNYAPDVAMAKIILANLH